MPIHVYGVQLERHCQVAVQNEQRKGSEALLADRERYNNDRR